MKKKRLLFAAAVLSALALGTTACSSGGTTDADSNGNDADSSDSSSAPEEVTDVTILGNWFAQAEMGGYFEAVAEGLTDGTNVNLQMKQGGPGIQTVPQVAAGEAEFGISHTDEVMVAISEGLPLVAVSSAFAKDIQCLAYHEDTGIEDFGDLAGHQVARVPSPYWDYIVEHYDLKGKVDPINVGGLATFKNDDNLVQQCFITSEPYTINQWDDQDIGYLNISDSGYTPYRNLLFTTQDFLKEHPDVVETVVDAVTQGWTDYLEDPSAGNDLIMKVNSDMEPEVLDFANGIFDEQPDLFADPIGSFDESQWEANKEQLVEAGVLPEDFDVTQAYTTEFANK